MEIYVAIATMLFCSDAHSVTVKSYDFIRDEFHKPLQRLEAGAYSESAHRKDAPCGN